LEKKKRKKGYGNPFIDMLIKTKKAAVNKYTNKRRRNEDKKEAQAVCLSVPLSKILRVRYPWCDVPISQAEYHRTFQRCKGPIR
jgi:hypothetical protein